VLTCVEQLVAFSASIHDQKNSTQTSLFGDAGEGLPEPRLSNPEDWLPTERLGEEHQAIGFYLSGHPLDDYLPALKRQRVMTLAEVTQVSQKGAFIGKIAGSVSGRQERKSARGNRFAFVQLSDPTGLYEATVFSDVLEKSRELLEPGSNVVLHVEATNEGDQVKLLARGVEDADQAVAGAAATGLRIFVNEQGAVPSLVTRLESATGGAKRGPVNIVLIDPALPAEVEIALKETVPVSPPLKSAIKHIPGVLEVEDF
jgi:DNA polymerase-3 subunit alpha